MAVDTSRLEAAIRNTWGMERAERLAEAFVDTARHNASRRTGAMADSVEITKRPSASGDRISVTVTVRSEYGRYQDEGTGIYGPDGQPIRPRSPGGVLRFDWPAAGGIVFARSVAGSPPTRWWQRTLDAWRSIVREVER